LKKNRLTDEIERAEVPFAVIGMLQGAEKPTISRAKKLENLAKKTEITFTSKEIARFDRDLRIGKKDLIVKKRDYF